MNLSKKDHIHIKGLRTFASLFLLLKVKIQAIYNDRSRMGGVCDAS